jgi:hypothetical protein
MDKDYLFLKTLEDIEKKLQSKDGYEIFMVSGLLRKLLMDDYPLIDNVNEQRRLKIKFRINNRKLPIRDPSLKFYSMEDGFDPDTSVPHKTFPLEVNKSRLLKSKLMIIDREVIEVRDLIKFLSHVMGGVHSGRPKNSKEIALLEIQKYLGLGGLPAGIRTIMSVARVVIKGLEPLKKAATK